VRKDHRRMSRPRRRCQGLGGGQFSLSRHHGRANLGIGRDDGHRFVDLVATNLVFHVAPVDAHARQRRERHAVGHGRDGRSSWTSIPRKIASHVTARYMAPVSRNDHRAARHRSGHVDLPEPAGPSIAMTRSLTPVARGRRRIWVARRDRVGRADRTASPAHPATALAITIR